MLSIADTLIQQYEDAMPYADPRTRNWFLLWNSPIYVWMLTALYFAFIWLGPKLMNNRPPFQLTGFMVFYNLGNVALSGYMFVEIILSTMGAGYPLWGCAPYNAETIKDPKEMRIASVMWWYFFSKAIELMDTVLMVLRKKNNQVSFLHVFHHVVMLNVWWWCMMFLPGGLTWFGVSLNCLVHMVMYAYYGLSVIPALKNKLWWKAYITKFQLLQFCTTLTHAVYSMTLDCDFPRWGQYFLTGFMISMLILFSNFYIHEYFFRKRKPDTKANKTQQNGSVANGVQASNGHVASKKLK